MSDLPKRTLDEIKARYFFEPSIHDIYVEGEFDNQIIMAWCRKYNEDKIVSYAINTVDIPMDVLKKYNLTAGNKQRVIALAKELSMEDLKGYRCLVDKDLDHWLECVDETKNLIWTEYCSLELYYFKEELIKSIIVDIASSKIVDWGEFFSSFILVLKSLYCLRLSDASLGFNMTWIELDRYISIRNGILFFDSHLYAERNIIQNKLSARKEDFFATLAQWSERVNGDPRLYIRGHDFVKIITLANKGLKGMKQFHEEVTIERLFFAFIDEVQELIDSVIKSL